MKHRVRLRALAVSVFAVGLNLSCSAPLRAQDTANIPASTERTDDTDIEVEHTDVSPQDDPEKSPPDGPDDEEKSDPFADEIAALNAATDRETRRAAFAAVLEKARTKNIDPAPLLDVLRFKQPAETFGDLLLWIQEKEESRHPSFLPHLVQLAYAPDGAAAKGALLAWKAEEVVDALAGLLKSEDLRVRVAAAAVSRERVGGLRGAARLIPPLVDALGDENSELSATAWRSLKTLSLREDLPQDAARWREWIDGKDENALIEDIGNRAVEAGRKLEADFRKLLEEHLKVLLDHMENAAAEDVPVLVAYLKGSPHLQVRKKAAELLGKLLPGLTDERASPAVEALGEVLNDISADEDLRIAAVHALAARPDAGFAHIDRCFEVNGNTPKLKLELVKALKTPRAASRLASLLAREIDAEEPADSQLLGALVSQAKSVVSNDAAEVARAAILAEFARLLAKIAERLQTELPKPARERYVELARGVGSTLVHVARLQAVDISSCVPALVDLAAGNNDASSGALAAVKEALGVQDAREDLLAMLQSEPLQGELAGLYAALAEANNEPMQVSLVGVYENMGAAPQEIADDLRRRLLEMAASASDPLTLAAGSRTTLRDAVRCFLVRYLKTTEARAALLGELLDCPFGDNDAIACLRVTEKPRARLVLAALEPRLEGEPLRIGRIMARLREDLNGGEKNELQDFRERVRAEVRATIAETIGSAIQAGLDETTKEQLAQIASGVLGSRFVEACFISLRAAPDPSGPGRDAIATLLLDHLQRVHPERYKDIVLAGDAGAFKTSLQTLRQRLLEEELKGDHYQLPE